MFAGITALALAADVHMAEDPAALIGFPTATTSAPRSARSALATFGETAPFFLLQGFTAAILILAANTAFNGFPVLSSLLGRDGYLPHQLSHRGDRLVFSNGIVAARGRRGAADRRVRRRGHAADPALHPRRVPVVHAQPGRDGAPLGARARRPRPAGAARDPAQAGAQRARRVRRPGLVFVIVLVTKFAQGAWIVVLAAPLLFAGHEGRSRATTRRVSASARAGGRRRRAARAHPRRRARLEPPGADAAGARLRAGDRARDACAPSRSPRPDADDPLADAMGRARRAAAAGDPGVALPRDRPADRSATSASCDASTRATSSSIVDPGVRRRALVGASPAQPDGAAAEGAAALRAVGHRDERALAARAQRHERR